MASIDLGEHLLALKVMRLTRPTLVAPQIITCESKDLPQQSFKRMLENDGTAVVGAECLAAGQFMLLPQSFGNIYLGETFSSYICVHNCTKLPVEGVTVKADLQSNSSRINLLMHEKQQKPAVLKPEETLDDVIRYEVKEIGTHILVCEVNYLTHAGMPKDFRKFFKFQVLKPLDVKTKFYNAEMDEIYLEAQIQNITNSPFCLEKVELDSSEHYTVTSLNTLSNGESVLSAKNMLEPFNSCQFLYCIKPKPEIAKDIKALRQANTVGKLDIVWRSNLGEKGRLQTSQLQRLPFEYKDVRLEVIEALNFVEINEAFNFTCRVTNTSEKPMQLEVKLKSKLQKGCSYIADADFPIGLLQPGENKEFKLTVAPTKLGLVKISPIVFKNVLSNETYTIEKVVEVFVIDQHDEMALAMNKFVRHDRGNSSRVEDQPFSMQVV